MERRKYTRFKMHKFLTYKLGRFKKDIESITQNVSLKGVSMLSYTKLNPQKNVKLRIYFGPQIGFKETVGKVIYSLPYQDRFGKSYVNGLEFPELIFNQEDSLSRDEY